MPGGGPEQGRLKHPGPHVASHGRDRHRALPADQLAVELLRRPDLTGLDLFTARDPGPVHPRPFPPTAPPRHRVHVPARGALALQTPGLGNVGTESICVADGSDDAADGWGDAGRGRDEDCSLVDAMPVSTAK
ncbi:hypothetical protein ABZZ74_50650 [Streptomyces sp. NPDC006476]|uniref:hypothetical protein n=1 Tax=Streptomyces sp. NPDC006476 TaxID=3157175 RepID=UPI0033A9A52B